jgi:hypothetical protein
VEKFSIWCVNRLKTFSIFLFFIEQWTLAKWEFQRLFILLRDRGIKEEKNKTTGTHTHKHTYNKIPQEHK